MIDGRRIFVPYALGIWSSDIYLERVREGGGEGEREREGKKEEKEQWNVNGTMNEKSMYDWSKKKQSEGTMISLTKLLNGLS